MAKFKAIYSIEGEYEFEAEDMTEAEDIIEELDYPDLMRRTYNLSDHLHIEPVVDSPLLDMIEDDDYPFEDVDIDECGYNPYSGGYDFDC